MRGLPFTLGPANVTRKSWIVLSQDQHSWTTRTIDIPIGRTAPFLCLAQFCDGRKPSSNPGHRRWRASATSPAILVYDDAPPAPSHPPLRSESALPPGRECMNAMQSNSWRPSNSTILQRGID
jgi:hypothetical protein